jgi:ankyrin repeat protein
MAAIHFASEHGHSGIVGGGFNHARFCQSSLAWCFCSKHSLFIPLLCTLSYTALLTAGANVTLRNSHGYTPLHFAAGNGQHASLAALLTHVTADAMAALDGVFLVTQLFFFFLSAND